MSLVDCLPSVVELVKSTNFMVIVLALILALFGITLYVLQTRKDSFDLRELLRDDTTGKLSILKIGQVVTLLVTTWGFVYLIMHDRFTEYYLLIYMAIWSGSDVAKDFANRGRISSTDLESERSKN